MFVVWAGNTCPHYKTKEMPLLWRIIMTKENRQFLEIYLEGIFRCRAKVENILNTEGKHQCVNICCRFPDQLRVSIDITPSEEIQLYGTLAQIDARKKVIAEQVYREILLMRVRTLCNVELGYF
jgi:hypothetical protein